MCAMSQRNPIICHMALAGISSSPMQTAFKLRGESWRSRKVVLGFELWVMGYELEVGIRRSSYRNYRLLLSIVYGVDQPDGTGFLVYCVLLQRQSDSLGGFGNEWTPPPQNRTTTNQPVCSRVIHYPSTGLRIASMKKHPSKNTRAYQCI